MDWSVKAFADLTLDDLYDVLNLRNLVFVVEQNCVYLDTDGHDQKALYVMGRKNGKLLACCRILLPGEKYPEWAVGRVVTAPEARKLGLGKELTRHAIDAVQQRGGQSIRISAQAYLKKFYQEQGFEVVGNPYDEDGIPHIEMLWMASGLRSAGGAV